MITLIALAIVALVGILFALMAVTPVLVESDRPNTQRPFKLVVVNNSAEKPDSEPQRVA